mgnify:CR=1 FL=1
MDRVIDCDQSTQMVEAIQAAGGNVIYDLLPGIDQDSWSPLKNLESHQWLWLFQQEPFQTKVRGNNK